MSIGGRVEATGQQFFRSLEIGQQNKGDHK